jgi:hypothetical protein
MRVGSGADQPPFDIDEAHKIAETHFWRLFAVERSWANPLWTTDFYARTNPPVAKYVFGAALSLSGAGIGDHDLQRQFERHWRQPARLRSLVPDEQLRTTRTTGILFAALTAGLLFLSAHAVAGWTAALMAPLLFLGNPAVAARLRLGLADPILLFLLTLMLPLTARAARSLAAVGRWPMGRRAFGMARVAVLPGLVVGLAAGTRVNGALAGLFLAGGLLLAALPGERAGLARRLAQAGLVLGLAGLIAVSVFAALNPWYHNEPLTRIVETLHLYRDWTVKQFVEPGGALLTVRERLATIGSFCLRSDSLPLSRLLGRPGGWLTSLGFAGGLVLLTEKAFLEAAAATRSEAGRSLVAGSCAVLVFVLVALSATALTLPLAWTRYLLVPYEAVCLAAAIGLGAIPRFAIAVTAALGAPLGTRFTRSALAAPLVALALWILLDFTPLLIAPELLHPGPDRSAPRSNAALDASDRESGVILYHRGLVLARSRRYSEAAAVLKRALDLLPERSPGEQARRLRARYELAMILSAAGDPAAAAAALEAHAAGVRQLRDALLSEDPKIRDEYDRIVAADEGLIGRLRNAPSPRGQGRDTAGGSARLSMRMPKTVPGRNGS